MILIFVQYHSIFLLLPICIWIILLPVVVQAVNTPPHSLLLVLELEQLIVVVGFSIVAIVGRNDTILFNAIRARDVI